MGNAQSNSVRRKQGWNAAVQRFEDMHHAYRASYHLLSELVVDENKRRLLAKLKGEEAQAMVDFLNRVLERRDLQGPATRKAILDALIALVGTAQVFPECLKLEGLKCDFDTPFHNGRFGNIYQGDFGGQAVCIKAIRTSQTAYAPEQLLRTHAKEAILSAHMSHPNILSFYGIYLCPDESLKVCIILPWMEHGDLLKYLQSFPNTPRMPLMSDMICGLAYMHELGIVHSNLTAKNVLVSEEGRAVLADFGTSHVTITTKTRVSVGESAELLTGHQNTSAMESDIWSYACTCYEVVTGARLSDQFESVLSLASAIEKGVITLTPPAGLQVDNDVGKMMKKCWAKEPEDRPTAAAVRQFFYRLDFKDDRPEISHRRLSIRVDRTIIDDAIVYNALQKIQKGSLTSEDTVEKRVRTASGLGITPGLRTEFHVEARTNASVRPLGRIGRGNIITRPGTVPGEKGNASKFSKETTDVSASSTQTSLDLLRMLVCTLRNKDSQKCLCDLKGDYAQVMVDYLDSVLLEPVLPETWLRKHCIIALYKLSKASLLYPHCYVLKESITFGSCEGGGTFSDIYRGRLGEKDLCLKVVRLHQKSHTDAMLKIYAKEAILWSQLYHPNIIPFYGIYYVNEMRRQLCLVSPWMRHGNLVEYLRRNPSVSRVPFVYDVVFGLEYLHSQGLVHSDLKGVNILVNDLERACITDFGLSFVRTDKTLSYAIASSTARGFTHRWAAPELLEDGATATMASDIWALGCVCYEIMTGLLPFNDLGEVQVVRALISGKVPKRPNASLNLSGSKTVIWGQMDRCWLVEPDDRPKCAQLLSELQSAGLSRESPAGAQGGEHEEQNYWAAIRKGGDKSVDLKTVEKILVELNSLTQ